MPNDTPYSVAADADVARLLHRSGHWDQALAVLPAGATALRARILTDRFFWRLDDPAEAESAVAALSPDDPVLAGFHGAQIAYTRLLFGIGRRAGDADRAREGFTAATGDARLGGWGWFWLGVLADHVDDAPETASTAYAEALELARRHDDRMLESYAVRHIGDHALRAGDTSGLGLLRRSYDLRAALGARPQTAAAAVTLAAELPSGPEADGLMESAAHTARELQLTWLLKAL